CVEPWSGTDPGSRTASLAALPHRRSPARCSGGVFTRRGWFGSAGSGRWGRALRRARTGTEAGTTPRTALAHGSPRACDAPGRNVTRRLEADRARPTGARATHDAAHVLLARRPGSRVTARRPAVAHPGPASGVPVGPPTEVSARPRAGGRVVGAAQTAW